ncbi:hypothetical protein M433DRAFT_335491 [Acidomyces richmondensis BFW]|nr:MAG: hypothetical protein FE78DRAFT_476814 [Acidomyces sp. 'richmondensis']KYG43761.1 hypothetical protein M433DRAFT_335491 [Acidomyces richmondensis BFW]
METVRRACQENGQGSIGMPDWSCSPGVGSAAVRGRSFARAVTACSGRGLILTVFSSTWRAETGNAQGPNGPMRHGSVDVNCKPVICVSVAGVGASRVWVSREEVGPSASPPRLAWLHALSHSPAFLLQQHDSTQSVSTLVVGLAQCASFFLVATSSWLVVCDPDAVPIPLLRRPGLAAVRCAARPSSKVASSHQHPSRTRGDPY